MLVDRGKLSLDSRLMDVLPGAPPYARDVTIRHLLTHTSGLVDYEDLIPDSQTVQVLDRDVLTSLNKIDSVYFSARRKVPIQQFRLCTPRSCRRGRLRPILRDVPETTDLQAPWNGSHRCVRERVSTLKNRAYGIPRQKTGFIQTDQSVTSAVLGDGGIYSSVNDFSMWDQELYNIGWSVPDSGSSHLRRQP